MKVSNTNPQLIDSLDAAKTQKPTLNKTEQNAEGIAKADLKGSATVDLSDSARQIQKAVELATPGDSIDEAKVSRLQKLIDEGKYGIDAEAIADRMVDEHFLMPS